MITDELREWTRRYAYFKADLNDIADRIDTEHRAALEKVAAMVDEPDEKREAYYDRFIAQMVDWDEGYADSIIAANSLERRVERIERLLRPRDKGSAFPDRFEELGHRVERIERLLSHKGGAA